MTGARPALDLQALTAIVDHTRSRALNEGEHRTLEAALARLTELTGELEKRHTSIQRLRQLLFGAKTEKTGNVLPHPPSEQNTGPSTTGDAQGPGEEADKKKKTRPGHGRHGAEDYPGAEQVEVKHPALSAGEACPLAGCEGRLYKLRDPGVILRVRGTSPLPVTLYTLEKLRCSLCGTVFTAPAPEGIGAHKYDVTAASMIACLKYGAGFPFNRLEKLQGNLGIPLPASTQWDIVHAASARIQPAWEALIEAAAQGEVL
jgi:transposase